MSGVLLAPLRTERKCAKGPVPMAKKLFTGSPIGLDAMAARRRPPSAAGGWPSGRPIVPLAFHHHENRPLRT
jgi:hypothetical protein